MTNIAHDEFMTGQMDAEARMPRRSASAAYNSGYAAGLAARAEVSEKTSIHFETITGMKISVKRVDGGAEWSVATSDNQVHMGTALDLETGVAYAEGCVRQLGHPAVRISQIEDQIRSLRPTASASEVQRLSGRVVDYITSHKAG